MRDQVVKLFLLLIGTTVGAPLPAFSGESSGNLTIRMTVTSGCEVSSSSLKGHQRIDERCSGASSYRVDVAHAHRGSEPDANVTLAAQTSGRKLVTIYW